MFILHYLFVFQFNYVKLQIRPKCGCFSNAIILTNGGATENDVFVEGSSLAIILKHVPVYCQYLRGIQLSG